METDMQLPAVITGLEKGRPACPRVGLASGQRRVQLHPLDRGGLCGQHPGDRDTRAGHCRGQHGGDPS
jgi:hypothetical protein